MRRPRLLLFALAFLTRLLFIYWRGPGIAPDTLDYLRIADNISHHMAFSLDPSPPYEPTILRPPFYPTFIASLQLTGAHGPVPIALVQSIIDGLVCVCVYSMALTVASRQVALLVALAYGFHPGAIVASTTLLSEGLFGSLCVFALFFLSQSLSRDSLPQSLAGGVFLGLAALTRSIGAIFPLLVLIAILMTRRNKRWLAHAIVVLSTAILVLIPWVIRSSLLARSFVLVQGPSFALNFYYPTRLDWNQRDQAAIWASFTTDDPCGKCSGSAKTPVEIAAVSRFCFQEALRNIRRAPIRYMFLRLRAFPQLFLTSFDSFTGINESFETGLKNRHLGRVMVKLILLVAFAAMPFSLAALSIRIATRDVVIGLCAVVCGFTLLIHIPMWIEYRYWQPVVPLLMVMAARGAESAALMAGKIAVAWRAAGDISEPPI